MNRKKKIMEVLEKSEKPLKGKELADMFDVSRQIIVSDIAQLREEGHKIVSTRDGYILERPNVVRRVVAMKHSVDDIYDELKIIVENGGRVIDVIVEHPVYGEIRGRLDISTLSDIESFLTLIKVSNTKPLMELSDGIHLHTIETDDEDTMEKVLKAIQKYRLIK